MTSRIEFEIKNIREPLNGYDLASRITAELVHQEGPGKFDISDVTIGYAVHLEGKEPYLGERDTDPMQAFASAIHNARIEEGKRLDPDKYSLSVNVQASYVQKEPQEPPTRARAGGAAQEKYRQEKPGDYF